MAETKKCAHPSCNCIPKEGKYCSTFCEGQAGTRTSSVNAVIRHALRSCELVDKHAFAS